MSKLYFLVPDTDLAGQIVAELKARQVSEDDIGVIANDQVDMEELPNAKLVDLSDVKPAAKQGAVAGGAVARLLAGLAGAIVPGGFAVGGAALAGMVLAGGAFGAWLSGLIGSSLPNREVSEFEAAIKAGSVLMIVNTAIIDREEVKRTLADRHPHVIFGGEDGVIPPVV